MKNLLARTNPLSGTLHLHCEDLIGHLAEIFECGGH
jgi:hypothetical protein